MNPGKRLLKAAKKHANVIVEANPSEERMDKLIQEAQLNLLVTFQGTGLKLKLLNCLFAGRHIVVNPLMVQGSGIENLCHIADSPQGIIDLCHRYINTFDRKKSKKETMAVPNLFQPGTSRQNRANGF